MTALLIVLVAVNALAVVEHYAFTRHLRDRVKTLETDAHTHELSLEQATEHTKVLITKHFDDLYEKIMKAAG